MLKKLMITSLALCIICIILPSIMGAIFLHSSINGKNDLLFQQEVYDAEIYFEDNNNNLEKIDYEKNNFEEYITGVVAAEMPATFQNEALKAQAVAARTYALKHLNGNIKNIDYSKIGQAYINIDDMKKRWKDSFEDNYSKVRNAVYSTKGLIMEYGGEPIEAVFHSTSAGITESAENVWGKSLPYIKSVESEEDKNAPNFITSVSFNKNDFEAKIKNSISSAKGLDNIFKNLKITKRSEAGYVLQVDLGSVIVKGSDIRTALSLRSTDFEIKKEKDKIIFTTKGYGHGAGMSQYGAEFMAKEGKSFEEILKHYYSGIEIVNMLILK